MSDKNIGNHIFEKRKQIDKLILMKSVTFL